MASSSAHSIQQILFELDTENRAQAQRLHSEISELFTHELHQKFEEIMDQCVGEEETIQLGRIEIDLGECEVGTSSRFCVSDSCGNCCWHFRRVSIKCVTATGIPMIRFTLNGVLRHSYAILSSILKQDDGPIRPPAQSLKVNDLLLELLRVEPDSLIVKLVPLLNRTAVQERLVAHSSAEVYWEVLRRVAPAAMSSIVRWAPMLKRPLHVRGIQIFPFLRIDYVYCFYN